MTFLYAAIISLVLGAVSFVPYWSWLAFPGFALGMAAWIWAVQMKNAYPPPRNRDIIILLGILGAGTGFAGIFFMFTLASLLYGGVMVF